MGEVVLAQKHINAMHLCRFGQDGVHARGITKDVATTAFDMCLTPRQIGEGLEDAKARLGKPDCKPRACGGLDFHACPNVAQHLHHGLLLARASLDLDEERLAAFGALFSKHLNT